MYKKADVVVDLQFGSTGKGLLCGYLSETGGYDTVVAANMPNAGHTYIDFKGNKMVHKVLPSGIYVSDNIMIGPGAVFDPVRLRKEIDECPIDLTGKRIMIHESAGVLRPEHVETERGALNRIASTMQGSAACLTDKIMRKESAIAKFNKDILYPLGLWKYVVPQFEFLGVMHEAKKILVEGSQGYSLGISSGFYPYCTSRECTAARVLADTATPVGYLNRVWGVARCHPIRVGNTEGGWSGNNYHDQKELSWDELGVEAEKTTVTGRIRRVFSFSRQQITEALIANQVTDVFLNFCNYDPALAQDIYEMINDIAIDLDLPARMSLTGWGPSANDVAAENGTF